MVRMLKDSDHPMVVVFYFPLVATPLMAIICLFYWVPPVGWDWLILIGIGVLTQFGQVYLSRALYMEQAGRMISIQFLGVFNALIFSIFLFRESYSLVNILGLILVISGVVLNIYVTNSKAAKTTD